jgi:hypothetical protein
MSLSGAVIQDFLSGQYNAPIRPLPSDFALENAEACSSPWSSSSRRTKKRIVDDLAEQRLDGLVIRLRQHLSWLFEPTTGVHQFGGGSFTIVDIRRSFPGTHLSRVIPSISGNVEPL